MSTTAGPISEAEAPGGLPEKTRGIRQCWVCQQEDTDDTPENNLWRVPCPCSLTAHDTCLLEWISNEEAPRPGEIARDRLIRCPQCRAEIKIQRPKDYVVVAFEAIQRMAGNMILPGAATSVLICTYAGLLVNGMNTLRVVFGDTDAMNMLRSESPPIGRLWKASRVFADIMKSFDPLIPSSQRLDLTKVFIGTPLIAPSLILLRTRWADRVFSFLLPWYFMHPANQRLSWPPPPGLVFATLPYLKTAYNELYKHTFRKWEIKWDMAVQRKPRVGETAEQIALEAEREETERFLEIRVALGDEENTETLEPEEESPEIPERLRRTYLQNLLQAQNPVENIQNIENVLEPSTSNNDNTNNEIQSPISDIIERNERDQIGTEQPLPTDPTQNNQILNTPDNDTEAIHNPRLLRDQGVLRQQANGNQAQEGHVNGRVAAPDDEWTVVHHFPASQLISLVVGALAFPPIAAVAGDILKYTLPSSLITPSVTYSMGTKVLKKGILTEKWGRTVVGGCLFVLLKDAVTLYCKWKRAREFGKRIIIDYVGPRNVST
ncbi:putative ring finger domain-containing protein [Golovinomyces cichoracearum]|uniref:Putative ring finger domain-containing protein n=1 Tax=Golovinomyces cichoracearum TaxID=62708 RepID=A0A420J5J1_9PEZI|nr:putative ring finger domain-containing protein [Golovinomyces cichoracearum]